LLFALKQRHGMPEDTRVGRREIF